MVLEQNLLMKAQTLNKVVQKYMFKLKKLSNDTNHFQVLINRMFSFYIYVSEIVTRKDIIV